MRKMVEQTNEEATVTYQIEVPKKTWDGFKDVVPRSKTLNDAIIELIKAKIKEKKGHV